MVPSGNCNDRSANTPDKTTFLTSDTVRRFFLDPMKCHADSEIWYALEKVHMKDKISALASQLHHSIKDKNFNTGDKQLIFLAKALLRQNKVTKKLRIIVITLSSIIITY